MNKILSLLFSITLLGCNASTPVKDDLGYQGRSSTQELSVDELLAQLEADPTVQMRTENGWKIAVPNSGRVLYSFTPNTHPAHPSYVKREVVEKDGAVYIQTSASCGAEKNVCDQLIRDFIELNNKVKNSMQSGGA